MGNRHSTARVPACGRYGGGFLIHNRSQRKNIPCKFQADASHINVGSGTDICITDLAQLIAKVTGFNGHIAFDSSKPDGTSRKLMNVERLSRMGWRSHISLEEGIRNSTGGSSPIGNSEDTILTRQ